MPTRANSREAGLFDVPDVGRVEKLDRHTRNALELLYVAVSIRRPNADITAIMEKRKKAYGLHVPPRIFDFTVAFVDRKVLEAAVGEILKASPNGEIRQELSGFAEFWSNPMRASPATAAKRRE